ncbi:MAG: hypothetical protein HDT30_07970 [Clostridiales bacterium]|nr:hypothetical protein [Clostridiales bacterium]
MFKKNVEKLLVSLELAQEKKDYESVAKYYLEIGEAYKKEGKVSKAIYYLNRFDNLVGGDNGLYAKFEKQDDKAMGWIAELEVEQEPYEKTIQEQVLEKSEDLNVLQKMQWMLLTMSRFCVLFQHISNLPDFEGFGKLDKMVDYFAKGLYFGKLDEDKEWEISDYGDYMDEVFDSSLMSDYTQKVEIPNQESFVLADLESGDVGTFYFTMAFGALQSFIFDELDEEDLDMEFVACGILADYYYRTCDVDIKDERKIQEEIERIFFDYDFVKEEPDKERFLERIGKYKKIMLI